jgi:hypothetical protein
MSVDLGNHFGDDYVKKRSSKRVYEEWEAFSLVTGPGTKKALRARVPLFHFISFIIILRYAVADTK